MTSLKANEFPLRTMVEEDLPQCQQLKRTIGWNQALADWRRFLSLNPKGCFVATSAEQIIGTVCTVAYRQCGWVAMVLVDPGYRRKGIGRELLLRGIDHLEQRGLTVKLDATPQGKLLYDTLGFNDEYNGARYECSSLRIETSSDGACQRIARINEIAELDLHIFGDDRSHVLQSYLDIHPEYAICAKDNGRLTGYLFAREGENAFHIGPWVALNEATARRLLIQCLLDRKAKDVFIDIVAPNPFAKLMLHNLGFTEQRPFIRMYRGANSNPGQPQYVYGMSGPELG